MLLEHSAAELGQPGTAMSPGPAAVGPIESWPPSAANFSSKAGKLLESSEHPPCCAWSVGCAAWLSEPEVEIAALPEEGCCKGNGAHSAGRGRTETKPFTEHTLLRGSMPASLAVSEAPVSCRCSPRMPRLPRACPVLGRELPALPRKLPAGDWSGVLCCGWSSDHMAAASMAARSAGGTPGRAATAASSTAAEASPSLEIRDGFCSTKHTVRARNKADHAPRTSLVRHIHTHNEQCRTHRL